MWLIGLAPVLVLPGGLDRFVFVKLAAVAAAFAVAVLSPRAARLRRDGALLLTAGSGVLALAAVCGREPVAQLIGRAPRYEGVVSISLYAASVALGAWLLGSQTASREREHLLRATAVAAGLAASVALAEAFGLRPLATDVARPGSLLGNATEQGVYGVVVVALGLATLLRGSRTWAAMAASMAGVVLVVTSASRGSLLGLTALLIIIAVSSRMLRVIRLVGATAVGILVLTLLVPLTRDRLLARTPLSGQTVHGRWMEWSEVLRLTVHHPLLGLGPSGFVDAWTSERSAEYVRYAGSLRLDSPHSLPLQVLSAGGSPLLVIAVAAAAVVGRRATALSRVPATAVWAAGAGAALGGWLVVLCTHFTSPVTTPYICVLAGSLLARQTSESAEGAPEPGGAGRPEPGRWRPFDRKPADVLLAAGACAAALVLIAAAVAEIPLYRGVLALNEGRPGATEAFDLASRLRPWDPDLDAALAHAAVTFPSSDVPHAQTRARVERALAAAPNDATITADAGRLDLLDGRRAAARVDFDRALRLSPNDPAILLARGQIEARLGATDVAEADLLRAVDLTPNDPVVLNALASVVDQAGRHDEAVGLRARASALPPGN